MKERKAKSKSTSLEDMMAYVDENGHISSTPPDPAKRKSIKREDIQIGVPKAKPYDPLEAIRMGTVTFFNHSKGYGFIKDNQNQQSIFVHINGCNGQIEEQSKVSFEVEMGPKGANAVNVKLID